MKLKPAVHNFNKPAVHNAALLANVSQLNVLSVLHA